MSTIYQLRLLGHTLLEQQGQPVRLGTRKALAILVILALSPERVGRLELAELLWPEQPEEKARGSLRQELSRLSQTLGEVLQLDGQWISLQRNAFQVDVWAFQQALQNKDWSAARAAYHGRFLHGFYLRDSSSFEDWQYTLQEQLHHQYSEVLLEHASQLAQNQQIKEALEVLQEAMQHNPIQEDAYLRSMELHRQQGEDAAIHRIYQALVQVLHHELGEEPSQQAQQVYASLQKPERSPLPQKLGIFLGRDTEFKEVLALLNRPDCRLLNIIGTGGIGKTRLALEAAHHLQNQGLKVHWVQVTTSTLFSAVADSLSIPALGRGDLAEAIRYHLTDTRPLLVLDEAELLSSHREVGWLLEHTPVRLLLTSRERLKLRSEWIYELSGLLLPEIGWDAASTRLFLYAAQRIRPQFLPSIQEREEIAEICKLLSGFPLAIEIAATWIRFMGCRDILSHLKESLDFLDVPLTDRPERQRSLRSILDSTLVTIPAEARNALVALVPCWGGFDFKAALHISRTGAGTLALLADHSLLQQPRMGEFRMLEVLRQHLRPEVPQAAYQHHAEYYARLLAEHTSNLRGGKQQEALQLLTPHKSNFHTAWDWAVKTQHHEVLEQMMQGMFLLHEIKGWFLEGVQVFEQAAATTSGPLHSAMLTRTGRFHYRLGRFQEARTCLQQSLNEEHSPRETTFILNNLGLVSLALGDLYGALSQFMLSREQAAQHQQTWHEANTHYNTGLTHQVLGNYPQAGEDYQKALELYQSLQDTRGMSLSLSGLGQISLHLGHYVSAQKRLQEALEQAENLGDLFARAGSLLNLGRVYQLQGQLQAAQEALQAGLSTFQQVGDQSGIARTLIALSELQTPLEATQTLQKALQTSQISHYTWGETLAHLNLGNRHLELQEQEVAKYHLQCCLTLAHQLRASLLVTQGLFSSLSLLNSTLRDSVTVYLQEHPGTEQRYREKLPSTAGLPLDITEDQLMQDVLKALQA
ncbi:tetratricopeptide repeat protein [Deinococcus roseus]|uniref:tetratricopeptide repeat protein n=1 Tax=Deinococcus roseus TaxID=392414 RepID=UPI001668A14B|nr:tetratricopeptide repeat protein [Deinococcus roseus]